MVYAVPSLAASEGTVLRLSLSQALVRADATALGVLVASAHFEEAISRLSQSRSTLLPQLTAIATGKRQTTDLGGSGILIPGQGPHIGPYNSFDARTRIVQTIFDVGAFKRLQAARLGRDLSAIQTQKAREDALALTASLYIQAQRADQHVHVPRQFWERDQRAWRIAHTAWKQGTASRLGYLKARAQRDQSLYLYRRAITTAAQKTADLSAALRIPLGTKIIFVETGGFSTRKNAGGNSAVDTALEVQIAQEELAVQVALASAAQGDYWPRLSLLGDYGRSGETPSQSSSTYMFGLQASLPIWEGGIKQANVVQARARVKEARAILEDRRWQNEANVSDAVEQIDLAEVMIQARKVQFFAAQEEWRLASLRFVQGQGQDLEVYTALAQKSLYQDELYEALAYRKMAVVELAHARGQMRSLIVDQ